MPHTNGHYDIFYEYSPWHTRVSLFDEEGRLLMLRFDDESRAYIEGTVILGRVRKISRGLKAAFIDIGDVQDGYLPLATVDNADKLTEGSALMVRITRGADGRKGARLDARVVQKAPENPEKIPCIVQKAPQALQRIIADAGDTPIRCWSPTKADYAYVKKYIPAEKFFALEDYPDVTLDETLQSYLDYIENGVFPIHGGGEVHIELTQALAAIDLDTAALSIETDAHILAFNKHAARAIVRLCRLLDLGGNIIVDFVTMRKPPHRKAVESMVRDECNKLDMPNIEVLRMSRFGLLEINRQRTGPMLPQLLHKPAFVAGNICIELWQRKNSSVGTRRVTAHFSVVDILKSRLTQASALAYLGHAVTITADDSLPLTQFRLAG